MASMYQELAEFRIQEIVSENVKRFIYESDITTEQLCYKAGLSIATINRLKAGTHLSIQGICALADVLERDPLDFFKEN